MVTTMNDAQRILLKLINDEGEITGYDASKKLKATVDYSHQQIYLELRKLLYAGYVVRVKNKQSAKPDKFIYSLSDNGRNKLELIQCEPIKLDHNQRCSIIAHIMSSTDDGFLIKKLSDHIFKLRGECEKIKDDDHPSAKLLLMRIHADINFCTLYIKFISGELIS